MINWSKVLSNQKSVLAVMEFATGEIGSSKLRKRLAHTVGSGVIKSALANRGAKTVRQLARKALRRRGLLTS